MNLYHPVLPYRHDDKLLFPLCARCAEEEMAKPLLDRSYHCPHTDEERTLTSTWCSPELVKAVELGYQVQYIYEVWHFPETCEGLFEDYVNTWLKIKQEASGWPEDNMTEEEKQTYIQNYFEHEGIQLDYDKIQKNPGLRTLAKLMLNSMWGKFGQRLNKTQIQTFDDPQAFHRFLDTDTLDVRHVSVINDDMVEVHYQHQEEDIPVSPNLNIFVAAFTTCHARLRLYEALEPLGERVLYLRHRLCYLLPKRRPTQSRLRSVTSGTSPLNWARTSTSKNLSVGVPKIMAIPPMRDTSNVRSEGSVSTARAKPNSTMTSCVRMSKTKSRHPS